MSGENKEQKTQVLGDGYILHIPKVNRNAEPVEGINHVEIGKEYLASFVYFGNETLSFVFQESGILGNQDRSGEDLVIGPEYARMPHDEAKKFMDIKKDSALNNIIPFNNCVVRFEVEYKTFQYPDARDPRPYSEYKVFVNMIHNPAQTDQPLVKIYAGYFVRVGDDRVEMRGDAHLHNTEILLGFLNTEELTNENDPRNQEEGLVGGDKDAGTPIPQIERKIPSIPDSDTESDTESDTDSDEPLLNEKVDEPLGNIDQAFLLLDENDNEVGEFRWVEVPPAEEHHPLSWILSIYDNTQQSWRKIVQIKDRLYKRLSPLRYYSRDELVGGETKQPANAQDIVAIWPPGFPPNIEYSFSLLLDKHICKTTEEGQDTEYLYRLGYSNYNKRYFLYCDGERDKQQREDVIYYQRGDERKKMYLDNIPESFILKLKNKNKLYDFDSYRQLKIKIETLKFERKSNQDGEKKSRKRSNTIGGKKKTYKKRSKLSKKTRKRKRKRNKKTKKQFLYNPNNPKKSFDVYIDKNPSDTIPIKYTTINDVKKTIRKLERLYKAGKYSHKRIWQVGMIMKVRLDAMMKHKKTLYKKAKNVRERRDLAKKYFLFLRSRSKEKNQKLRKVMRFKIN